MKSKKWFISLGLAVVLVVAFAIPACTGEPTEYWYTPEGEKISFTITTLSGKPFDVISMVAENLRDFGLDVEDETLDYTTYEEYVWQPNLGELEAFFFTESAPTDPWGGWIWWLYTDPEGLGIYWNPTWYYTPHVEDLMKQNVWYAPNLTVKEEVLLELQEIIAEEIPEVFLVHPAMITVCREDNWTNWHNQQGGHATWINEHTMREVTPVGNATRLNIGTMELMSSLDMEQWTVMYTNAGCLYLMMVYENFQFVPKMDEATLESNPNAPYDHVPKLLTAFSVNYEDDGTGGQNQVWTIDLRQGVKWHDYETSGKNFTADDVVYTLKNVVADWSPMIPVDWVAVEANGGEILPEHVLVEKTGTYQVEWKFIEGHHLTEDYLATGWGGVSMLPEHVFGPAGNGTYENWNEDWAMWDGESIGTGPWMVKEFVPDSHILFERFDDYWGADVEEVGLPAAQEMLWKLYTSYGALWMALEAGEIDAVMDEGAPHVKYDEYVANPDLTVEIVPDISFINLGFNLHPTAGYEPLQDLALREAIAAAIDKQAILDIVYGGFGEVAQTWLFRDNPMHHPALPNQEYDPTLAASILTAAGYTKHA